VPTPYERPAQFRGPNKTSPQAVGLRAWWPVERFTGTASSTTRVLKDHAGRGHHATLPSLATGFHTTLNYARFGPAVLCSATNHVGALVTRASQLIAIPLTYNFAIFFRAGAPSFAAAALAAIAFDGTDDLIIYPYSSTSNGPRVFWRDLGGQIISLAGPAANTALNDFCFVSYAANDHRLFVNGFQVATSAATGTVGPFTSLSLLGYAENNTQNYIGRITDIRLYDKAPSPGLIRAMSDPRTRFDLFLPAPTRGAYLPSAAAGGNRRRRVLIAA
jgi:hypothetical protein